MTDRELDALVAEKVMGWKRQKDSDWWPIPCQGSYCEAEKPRFWSTDISATWEVVEKMESEGFLFYIEKLRNMYCVDFGKWKEKKAPIAGPVLCRSICVAALKAVGVEVKDV